MIFSCELKFKAGAQEMPASDLLAQSEIDVNLSDDFHRLAVKQGRFVNPLLYRIGRRLNQHRVTAYQLKILDGAILADNGRETHRSLNTGRLR